ncbi:Dephospho-CoA kinase [Shewanella sediminis HAW-EB3]|uniref:Dephospho-CoA kinase n=1 Tax=Shewanella sediminis (strain HAW-EB3) TaxID=425104 RepID=A8FQB2_SHESH|nr:dephospho-CoA kinase [Shewanella sediminis]ABV35035.1 Dephospho-CoA kinase [Shewanella sediminis HAW-EB3]
MSKFIVGLTGGIGSGKTTVANMFAELGVELVDADIIAREVVEVGSKGLNEISAHFGNTILNKDKSLNRATLRELIFSQPDERQWLNDLMHPMIRSKILKCIESTTSPYAILVAPLLFENGLDRLVNLSLLVDISPEQQLDRTIDRDSVSSEQIKNIIDSQAPRAERLSKADDVIDNHGKISALKGKVITLHNNYLKLANNT